MNPAGLVWVSQPCCTSITSLDSLVLLGLVVGGDDLVDFRLLLRVLHLLSHLRTRPTLDVFHREFGLFFPAGAAVNGVSALTRGIHGDVVDVWALITCVWSAASRGFLVGLSCAFTSRALSASLAAALPGTCGFGLGGRFGARACAARTGNRNRDGSASRGSGIPSSRGSAGTRACPGAVLCFSQICR